MHWILSLLILSIPFLFYILIVLINFEYKAELFVGITGPLLIIGAILVPITLFGHVNVVGALMFLRWTFWIHIIVAFVYLRFTKDDYYVVKEGILKTTKFLLGVLMVAFILVSFIAIPIILRVQYGYGTIIMREALYMSENVEIIDDLPFENEPLDTDIRLVTKEFAFSKANQHSSSFGSNIRIAEANVILYNGSLYWCVMYAYTRNFPEKNNKIIGIVLVDVSNPNAQPIIIEPESFNYADGLARFHNINTQVYMDNTNLKFGYMRNYPAYDEEREEWVYVVSRIKKVFGSTDIPDGINIIDVETAEIIAHYDDPQEYPPYVIQPWSEEWFEYMLYVWGQKRDTRFTNDVNYFAGNGFFRRKSIDRFEISEDTRYIKNPDTDNIISLTATNPIGARNTLDGLFVTSHEGFKYYSLKSRGYISTSTAGNIAQGLPSARSGGFYSSVMPIFYVLNTTVGKRACYYIPIYWISNTRDISRLSHFAIIDALDTSKVVLEEIGEYTDISKIIERARIRYKNQFEAEDDTIYNLKTGTLIKKAYYISNGFTIYVLNISFNDEYIIASADEIHLQTYVNSTMNITREEQWKELVLAEEGILIEFYTHMINDVLWLKHFIQG